MVRRSAPASNMYSGRSFDAGVRPASFFVDGSQNLLVTRTVSRLTMGLEKEPSDTKPLSGLEIEEIKLGAGLAAYRGDRVTVRYSGFLNRGDAFQTDVTTSFTLGERNVIAGLEHGLEGMRVGGIRKLRVSPHLAYRDTGIPGVIPPNAVLVFEIEILSIG